MDATSGAVPPIGCMCRRTAGAEAVAESSQDSAEHAHDHIIGAVLTWVILYSVLDCFYKAAKRDRDARINLVHLHVLRSVNYWSMQAEVYRTCRWLQDSVLIVAYRSRCATTCLVLMRCSHGQGELQIEIARPRDQRFVPLAANSPL